MDDIKISDRAIKDYCFDYDEEKDEIDGYSYRKTNPKKLLKGIDFKELFNGNDVLFEVCKGYDESVLEEADPDVFNDILFSSSDYMRENRGAPLPTCSFNDIDQRMENVTENGFVKKQIITNGVGDIVPENSYVTVEYNLYTEDYELPFDSTYLRKKAEKFRLDRIETIPGLHYAIKSMKKKENSRFLINWQYAFGSLGCPDRIKPKSNILADVTVTDFVEIESEDFNDEGEPHVTKYSFTKSLNEAKEYHVNGTQNFKKGETLEAIKSYRKGLRILNALPLNDETEESAMLRQKVKCLVNLALCYNKIGKFEQACLACQDILAIDSNNIKAFFHYGRATLGLSNFEASRKWLMKAAKIKPHDQDINDELKKLDEKHSQHKALNKDFWEKAFKTMHIDETKADGKS